MQRIIIGLMLVFAACTPVKKITSVAGTWKLHSVVGSDISVEKDYSVMITDTTISGVLPCNKFSGKLEKENSKCQIKQLMSTKRYCDGMVLETTVLTAMRKCDQITVKGKQLIFFTEGKQTLVYTK